MKSTKAPNNRAKQQPREQEESEIHPNLIRSNLSSGDNSLPSDLDSAFTSPSIIISAKNVISGSDADA